MTWVTIQRGNFNIGMHLEVLIEEEEKFITNIINKTMEQNKEITGGQKVVGLNFNHAEGDLNQKVHKAKQLSANLLDLLSSHKIDLHGRSTTAQPSWFFNVFYTAALNAVVTAQMAVVKLLTWKD